MATGSNIRVGDADRDATATQLREHYAAGRLTLVSSCLWPRMSRTMPRKA